MGRPAGSHNDIEENIMHLSSKRAALAAIIASSAIVAGTFTTLAARQGAVPTQLSLGSASMHSQSIYLGYYDGHKDSYINSDVSDRAQAMAWHINYAPLLANTLK